MEKDNMSGKAINITEYVKNQMGKSLDLFAKITSRLINLSKQIDEKIIGIISIGDRDITQLKLDDFSQFHVLNEEYKLLSFELSKLATRIRLIQDFGAALDISFEYVGVNKDNHDIINKDNVTDICIVEEDGMVKYSNPEVFDILKRDFEKSSKIRPDFINICYTNLKEQYNYTQELKKSRESVNGKKEESKGK